MKIINSKRKKYAEDFDEVNDWFNDDTIREMRNYRSEEDLQVYNLDANQEVMPNIETDEEAEGILADGYVEEEYGMPSTIDDALQEGDELRRLQEEEPLIKKKEDVDIVDESVAEETEVDERVPDFGTAKEAIEWAKAKGRVLEIFYVTKGRGSRDEDRYLKRERGLPRTEIGGVHIHRIVEPHYIYTTKKQIKSKDIVVTYDRSVRRIRSFIIDNIYEYNFTKNRRTKKDQYFKPRNKVMPKTLSNSGKGIKTMKNLNEKLTKIASTLEDKGLKESSLVIKNAIKVSTNYKMAQYVGVQGYWLRNRRCWDNCYRHKRAVQPGGSAQEVWMECWEEYKDSINNPKSTWAKYANKDDVIKISKTEEQEWNKIFADKVDIKVSEGLKRPEAVYDVIQTESQAYASKIIEAASDLMTLADTLVKNGSDELGEQMAEAAIEMLKEADFQGQQQNWVGKGVDKVKDFFGGFRGQGGKADVVKKIQDVISRANELLSMLNNPQMPQQAQASEVTGFIIEAGKGTRIVEAQPSGTPTRMGPNPIGRKDPESGKQKYRATPADQQNQQGDKDQDGEPDSTDKDDTPPDNQPDAPQPEDAPQQAPAVEGDKDNDTVPDSVDKDDSPPDNQPDAPQPEDAPAEKRQNTPGGLNESYLSLVKDVAGLSQEFSGLQTAKDPQVAQYAQGAAPLLQKFVGNSTELRKLPPGTEQRQALRGTLQQLTTDLQGVLAGQPASAQLGDMGDPQMGGQQVGDQQLVNPQMGGQQVDPQAQQMDVSGLVKAVAGVKNSEQLAQSLNTPNVPSNYLDFIIGAFEKNGVPFNTANWAQFKNELVALFANQNTQQAPMQRAGSFIWQKRK